MAYWHIGILATWLKGRPPPTAHSHTSSAIDYAYSPIGHAYSPIGHAYSPIGHRPCLQLHRPCLQPAYSSIGHAYSSIGQLSPCCIGKKLGHIHQPNNTELWPDTVVPRNPSPCLSRISLLQC